MPSSSIAILKGHSDWIYSLCYLQSQQFLISGGKDGNLKIWDMRTMRCVNSIHAMNGSIRAIIYMKRFINFLKLKNLIILIKYN